MQVYGFMVPLKIIIGVLQSFKVVNLHFEIIIRKGQINT